MKSRKTIVAFAVFNSLLLWLAGITILIDLFLAVATYGLARMQFFSLRRTYRAMREAAEPVVAMASEVVDVAATGGRPQAFAPVDRANEDAAMPIHALRH